MKLSGEEKVVNIFNGNLSIGNSTTLAESINKFKMLYIKVGVSSSYVSVPVIPSQNSLRGLNAYASSTSLDTVSVLATKSADGKTFTLNNVSDWRISASGNNNLGTYNTVTEIWRVV